MGVGGTLQFRANEGNKREKEEEGELEDGEAAAVPERVVIEGGGGRTLTETVSVV